MIHDISPENYRGEVLELDKATWDIILITNYCVTFVYNPSEKSDMKALKEFKKPAKMIHEKVDSHTKFVSIDSRIGIFAE